MPSLCFFSEVDSSEKEKKESPDQVLILGHREAMGRGGKSKDEWGRGMEDKGRHFVNGKKQTVLFFHLLTFLKERLPNSFLCEDTQKGRGANNEQKENINREI